MATRSRARTACLVLALTGCASDDQSAPQTSSNLGTARVATMNGAPLPETLFRYYVINVQRKNPDALTESERVQAIEELLQLKLLADAALDRGLLNERTIAAEVELQRLQVIARRMALRYLEQNPATDDEVRAMYERTLPQLALMEYKLRHILVDTEEEARAAIERLRQGAEFELLAQELSGGPTAENGGDLGWLTAETMVPPLSEAIRRLQRGEYSSEPVQTDFGYHVLLLEETRQQEAPPLDAIRGELAAAVDREKLETYIAAMREGATVDMTATP